MKKWLYALLACLLTVCTVAGMAIPASAAVKHMDVYHLDVSAAQIVTKEGDTTFVPVVDPGAGHSFVLTIPSKQMPGQGKEKTGTLRWTIPGSQADKTSVLTYITPEGSTGIAKLYAYWSKKKANRAYLFKDIDLKDKDGNDVGVTSWDAAGDRTSFDLVSILGKRPSGSDLVVELEFIVKRVFSPTHNSLMVGGISLNNQKEALPLDPSGFKFYTGGTGMFGVRMDYEDGYSFVAKRPARAEDDALSGSFYNTISLESLQNYPYLVLDIADDATGIISVEVYTHYDEGQKAELISKKPVSALRGRTVYNLKETLAKFGGDKERSIIKINMHYDAADPSSKELKVKGIWRQKTADVVADPGAETPKTNDEPTTTSENGSATEATEPSTDASSSEPETDPTAGGEVTEPGSTTGTVATEANNTAAQSTQASSEPESDGIGWLIPVIIAAVVVVACVVAGVLIAKKKKG